MPIRERANAIFRLSFLLQAAAIGLAVGLATPMLEMLMQATSLEPAYESLGTLLEGLGILLVGYAAWYALIFVAAVIPASLLTPLPPTALSAVAAFFAAIPAYQTFGGTAPQVWMATTLLSVIVLLATWRKSPSGRPSSRIGLLAAIAGIVLLEAFAFHWLTRFPLRSWARGESTTAIALYGVIVLATSLGVLRAASSRVVGAAFAVGLLTVAWTPARKLNEVRYLQAPITAGQASPKIPHIILIVVDTLRADALTYRNPDARPTPNIDKFAADSVVFENAISPAPWTLPAVNALMTGVPPYIDPESLSYPTAPLRTLADYLLDAGYRTGLVSGNALIDRPENLVHGIMEADVYAALATGGYRTSLVLWDRAPELEAEANTAAVTNRAIDWMRAGADSPFFLWMQYFDPHDPYAPPARYLEAAAATPGLTAPYAASSVREEDRPAYTDYYRAEVQVVDEHIGRVMAELRDLGIYDDSLIIVTSDHGEEFWDHGGTVHGGSLYQEVLHVPLMVKLPGEAPGRRIKTFTPTLALLPTILELAEIPAEPRAGWTPSLKPLLDAETDAYPAPIVSAGTGRGKFQRGVVADGMKYISWLDTGAEAVFDLAADPHELEDLSAAKPDFVTRARKVVATHEEQSAAIRKEFGLDERLGETTPEMLDKLRSLGYIQ